MSSAVPQKFVEYVSPRSGRKQVAHGASRGFESPSLTPVPLPLGRQRGAAGGVRAVKHRAQKLGKINRLSS